MRGHKIYLNSKCVSTFQRGHIKHLSLFLISCFCIDGKISVRINLPLFSIIVPASICKFLSCRPFVVITTLSTGLVGVTSTPTRPVGNVVITTKGLQDRNLHILAGTMVENKGKLILSEESF